MSNFPDTMTAGAPSFHEQDTRKNRFLLRRLHFLIFYTDALFLLAGGYFWYRALLASKTPEMIFQYMFPVSLCPESLARHHLRYAIRVQEHNI